MDLDRRAAVFEVVRFGAGADDGEATLVLDFNFAYNPSCAYDPAWACPLAQAGNTLPVEVPVGERYAGA